MRRLAIGLLPLWLLGTACEQTQVPSFVYGWLQGNFINGTQQSLSFEGSLDKKDGRYYGFCNYEDGAFSFVVGTAALSESMTGSDVYVAVSGIPGPPIEGVFEGGAPKQDEALARSFGQAYLRKTYSWTVGAKEREAAFDTCDVALFAASAQGEVIKDNKQPFDYYVRLVCSGLNVTPAEGDGMMLQHFYMEFYFRGC